MIDFLKQITIFFYKIFPRPYGIGYNQYKIRIIKKILDNKEINLVRYIDERIVEIPWIMQNLNNIENNEILDAGCTLNFNYLIKKLIKKKNNLTFINLYQEKNIFKSDMVNYQTQDITDIKFENSFFDVITCISVIEHIGFDNSHYNFSSTKKKINFNKLKYLTALQNIKKLLKKKGNFFISIPFGKKKHIKIYNNLIP